MIFIYASIINNTDNVITIDTNENMFQLVGVELKRDVGRLNVTNSDTKLKATGTNFIGTTYTFNLQTNTSTVIYGFLFTN